MSIKGLKCFPLLVTGSCREVSGFVGESLVTGSLFLLTKEEKQAFQNIPFIHDGIWASSTVSRADFVAQDSFLATRLILLLLLKPSTVFIVG
jgi:hypothetical protein